MRLSMKYYAYHFNFLVHLYIMDILLMFIIIVRIKIRRVRKMQYFVYNNTEEKHIILPSLLPLLNNEIWPTISTPMKTTFVAHHFTCTLPQADPD